MHALTRWAGIFLAVLGAAAVLAGEVPKEPPPLDRLLDAAQVALASCKASGYAVTVSVLDADFGMRILLRADAAPERTVDTARRKAYTAIKTGQSSADYGRTLAQSGPASPGVSAGGVAEDPNLITWAGGLPVSVGGKIVAAIGVSGAPGGDKDEACARAALERLASSAR
jgi:uncharacterized protein GlcG (DUF336 family)